MRSDWDEHFKSEKPRDQQKRYPPITEEEWRILLRYARSHLDGLVTHLPPIGAAEKRHALQLVKKIERRLGIER